MAKSVSALGPDLHRWPPVHHPPLVGTPLWRSKSAGVVTRLPTTRAMVAGRRNGLAFLLIEEAGHNDAEVPRMTETIRHSYPFSGRDQMQQIMRHSPDAQPLARYITSGLRSGAHSLYPGGTRLQGRLPETGTNIRSWSAHTRLPCGWPLAGRWLSGTAGSWAFPLTDPENSKCT